MYFHYLMSVVSKKIFWLLHFIKLTSIESASQRWLQLDSVNHIFNYNYIRKESVKQLWEIPHIFDLFKERISRQHKTVADPAFSRRRAPPPGLWGENLLFGKVFAENYMKMKQIRLRGRVPSTHPDPFGSVNGQVLQGIYYPKFGPTCLSCACTFKNSRACAHIVITLLQPHYHQNQGQGRIYDFPEE